MSTRERPRARRRGFSGLRGAMAGIIASSVAFVFGMAIGATISQSPVQERIPIRSDSPWQDLLQVVGPGTVPLYVAVLAFPMLLALARRYPIVRTHWPRRLALWSGVALATAAAAEALHLLLISAVFPRGVDAAYFLGMRLTATLPILLGAIGLAHMIAGREKEKRAAVETARARTALAEARLQALTARLQPHFLFNTLQSISTLIHRDPGAADRMLGRLGELLRASLTHSGAREVRLSEELAIIQEYLAISRERFGDRLCVEIQAEPECLDANVPPFLLQPLVENAVLHGLESRAGGQVRIHCRVRGDALVLEVANDGIPQDNRALRRDGVGLGTTRERLRTLYGDDQSLVVEFPASGGATVRMTLPRRGGAVQG